MILITGSNGFLGSNLCNSLKSQGDSYKTLARNNADINIDLTSNFDITKQLAGIDCVVHCAARAHKMQDKGFGVAYFDCNLDATVKLAKQCLKAQVKKFVFISTSKVYGEFSTKSGFSETDAVNPSDDYAKSKLAAERKLLELATKDFSVIILRLPLLYGRGQKGNMQLLAKVISKNMPLPLGCANKNLRSLLFIGNATAAINWAATVSDVSNQIFNIADATPVSTLQILQQLKVKLNSKTILFKIPLVVIKLILAILRRSASYRRLTQNFVLNTTKVNKYWSPPYSFVQGLDTFD